MSMILLRSSIDSQTDRYLLCNGSTTYSKIDHPMYIEMNLHVWDRDIK